MRTEYFTNCTAVFEGGGVRGAAYAGAYSAALNAGIRFSRVAGSSAGSVAAAFIAAGGTPEAIEEKLLELDMASLQRPADKKDVPFGKAGFLAASLTKMPSAFLKNVGRFVCYSGGFSSIAVRGWVEKSLREMLVARGKPSFERPVRFSDLKIPLYVVAADVLQKSPKIWSLEATPDDSVAFAVQASCAIPFYFQAVTSAQSVFVDGGTISNVPSHVFPLRNGHPGRFAEKTLAFRLKSNPSTPQTKFEDAFGYAFGIADTVVASSTAIQQSLQPGVYCIEIGTGDIKATDFTKMSATVKAQLVASGKKAVEDFIAREREVVGRHQITTRYVGFDERLLSYVFAILEAKETIWISDSSTYWLLFIFPIIASAIARGVVVKVMVQDPAPREPIVEARRRASLQSLGCDVVNVKNLAFTGLVVDYPGAASIAVISSESGSVGQDFEYGGEQVRLYRSQDDLPVIRNLGNALASQVSSAGQAVAKSLSKVEIISLSPEDLFSGLKRVSQYKNADFSIEEIYFDDRLRVSQTHVKEFRLLQVEELVRRLQRSGFDLFAPCQYRLADGTFSVITPPVLEMTPQGPVIIEGHTRAFYMSQLKRDRFRAVVVRNVSEPLPVMPRAFSEMRVADSTMTVAAILPNHERRLLRRIEAAMHP